MDASTRHMWVNLDCFQNPREADAMSKINADLDETKIILVSYFKIVIYS